MALEYHLLKQVNVILMDGRLRFMPSVCGISMCIRNQRRRIASTCCLWMKSVLTAYTDLTVVPKDVRSTKPVSFELQNHECWRLHHTLSSEHAEQFMTLMQNFDEGQHVIAIIQLGKVTRLKGNPNLIVTGLRYCLQDLQEIN